jgi:hypothetical protein
MKGDKNPALSRVGNPEGLHLGDRVQHKWDYVYDHRRGHIKGWQSGGYIHDNNWARVKWDDGTWSQAHATDLVKVTILDELADIE